MDQKERRELMPESSAVLEEFWKAFGLAWFKAVENGRTLEWEAKRGTNANG